MANETFNLEASTSAIKAAISEIENACANFSSNAEKTAMALSGEGNAIGGRAGQVAAKAFCDGNETQFNNLKKCLDSFSNRVDDIIKANANTQTTVNSTYGTM